MTAIYQSRDIAIAAADKLKVYAQPQRLMILSCLLVGERTVSQIYSATGIGQPALSQQLAELRRAELVKTRREAKQIWYELADDNIMLCVRTMETILGTAEDAKTVLIDALRPNRTTVTQLSSAGTARFARIC